jgi:hypothetical protein
MQPCESTVVVARAKKKNKKENRKKRKKNKQPQFLPSFLPYFLSFPPPGPRPRPSQSTRNVTVAVLFHRGCLCTNRQPNPTTPPPVSVNGLHDSRVFAAAAAAATAAAGCR